MATNKLKLDPEVLDVEYNMLLEELKDLEDMYTSSNSILKNFTKMPTRSSPTFIANQTANLISIKEKRLNIIKELTNIKKSKMDMEAKMFTANNKLEEQSNGVSQEILEIYRMLNKADKTAMIKNSVEEDIENSQNDQDIDKLLNERLNIATEEQKEETKKTQILPEDYRIVCAKENGKNNLYIIDGNYNIIEDCDFDLSLIHIVDFESLDCDEYAIDEDGNRFEVVEI